MTRVGGGLLVAGQSLAEDPHTEPVLMDGEVLAGPLLLFAMFVGSLTVGLRALPPVEQSRRRQLEFSADASHELRTPLSVITAETNMALSGRGRPAEYRAALTRIQGESRRLRSSSRTCSGWPGSTRRRRRPALSRLTSARSPPSCADRFSALATARSHWRWLAQAADADHRAARVDRQAGRRPRRQRLPPRRCRRQGQHHRWRRGSRVWLAVEDSGPGMPEAERPRLFDRFHRATEQGRGAGLGLAIGDSIVRSTGGRWRIGDSPLGGALMEVSWRHSQPHRIPTPRLTASHLTGDGP